MDPRAQKERWAGILSVNDSDNFYTEAIVKEMLFLFTDSFAK